MTDLEKIEKLRKIDNFAPRPIVKQRRKSNCKSCEVRRPRSR